jgi:ABC-type Mn2+/Zn2+ transport system ATPase subunit
MRLVIQARALALGYRGREVLHDVDLEIGEGQFWFLVGPNGSGKTTLLRALLRELRPMRGALLCDPERVGPEHVGFVPQRSEINPALPTTLREFVGLGLVGLRVPAKEARARLRETLAEVGLAGFEERDHGSLSGGENQRALLARALIRRPRTLLFDEPTSGLDLTSEHALLRLLERLNREEGLTVVVVSHDLSLAARYATHVAAFHERSVASGPRDAILNEETLRRAYGTEVTLDAGAVRVGGEGGP